MDKDAYALGAKYYDGAYENNPNLNDRPFYVELAQKYGGPVLEIACGTGRILLEIARKGIEIHGIDFSKEQLAVLSAKLAREPESVRNRVRISGGDMRSFSLDRKFRLVISPFRPMQHMYTIEDQVRALNAAKRHLLPGAVLAFDVFFPDFSLLLQPPGGEILEMEWPAAGAPGQVVRRYFRRTNVDLVRQFFEGDFIFRTLDGDRLVREERSRLKLGYYTYPHLQLLFRHCGLEVVEEYGSFKREPIEVRKDMIFVLRAKN